jgi:hypothetical protein
MHMYKDTDINELVHTSYLALVGPPAVIFSKELVAYLETLITFSFYYRADNGSMSESASGKMEQFYTQALACY